MKILTKMMAATAITAAGTLAANAGSHAEKWDMPMAYSASNFHTENGVKFADCVRKAQAVRLT